VVRPRQWLKNVLVFMAPAAAGQLHHGSVALRALGTFALFCVAASGTYLVNDALDAERDRAHPTKRHRPVAAGAISPLAAIAAGAAALVVSLALAVPVGGWRLLLVLGLYVASTTAYSSYLKRVAVVEMVVVALGFVLRAIAGGVATNVPLSNWFLIVTCFASLLVVSGKRLAEKQAAADGGAGTTRAVLTEYTTSFLRQVVLLSTAVTVTAYCLWAFDRGGASYHGGRPLWFQLSILPFVLGVLLVLRSAESGQGEAPDELVLHDRALQVTGLVWLVLLALGVYG
jgi:decaprenyl-phosphate phosphoribosyltransferase